MPLRSARALAVLRRGLLLALLAASATHAQPARVAIDLPAAPLDRALTLLARQSGVQILFASEVAAGRRARALQGRYSPHQALDRLLAEHGLEAVERAPGVYLVRAPGAAGAGATHPSAAAFPDPEPVR